MNFLRAALKEIVSLFVSDWFQVAIVLAILGLGWLAVAKVGTPALVVLVLLLAAQMVWFARAEARRRQGIQRAKQSPQPSPN